MKRVHLKIGSQPLTVVIVMVDIRGNTKVVGRGYNVVGKMGKSVVFPQSHENIGSDSQPNFLAYSVDVNLLIYKTVFRYVYT